VKVLRILSIPTIALGMLTLLTATASANHATVSAAFNCTSSTKVCFTLTVSTVDFQAERHLTFTLLGHQKGAPADKLTAIGTAQTLPFQNNLDDATSTLCFDGIETTKFDSFQLDVKAVESDLTVNGQSEVKLGPFQNTCPTPATPPPTTPTATANTTVALAQTGGFDFRYPLIGLVLLVIGGALFVVSASRRRSADTK